MISPNDIKEIYLEIGAFFWGGPNYRITTVLGSCVSICIWHPQKKIGGICHYAMPGYREKRRAKLNSRYGDDVIWMMLDKIKMSNTIPKEYVTKIFGGANVIINDNNILNIGQKNVIKAFERTKKAGFLINTQDVGGTKSRKLRFDLWSGDVWMKKFE